MGGMGSLGLDNTLCYFTHMGQYVKTGCRCPPRVIGYQYVDRPVLHQEASLQKICALEINQAANELTISHCIPSTTALLIDVPLLLYAVPP